MSSAYYYFAASLPMLELGKKPPMTTEFFLEESRRLLSERDFLDIVRALKDNEAAAANPVLKSWQQFERYLRNELVVLRARQLNKDPQAFMRGERGVETAIMDAISQVVKSPDPLSAEKILDQMRWQKLDELGLGHFFGLEFLIIYALRLKILERYERIGSEQGEESFQKHKEQFIRGKVVFA